MEEESSGNQECTAGGADDAETADDVLSRAPGRRGSCDDCTLYGQNPSKTSHYVVK